MVRAQLDERWFVPLAAEPAILIFQFGDLDRASSLFVEIILQGIAAPAWVGEIEDVRAVAADDHVRMAALDFIIGADSGLFQQILRSP